MVEEVDAVLDGEGVDAEEDVIEGLVALLAELRRLKGDQGGESPRLDLRTCFSDLDGAVGIPGSGIEVPELRRKAFFTLVESEREGREE